MELDNIAEKEGDEKEGDDNDNYSLLEDFQDGDLELEDPFKFGTEEIMKDILEDDVV